MLIIKQRGKLTFNSLNKECNETEEIRTAYVAMTRPQKILIMALPKSVKKNFEKSTKFDKKFWTYIDLQINRLKEVKNKNTIIKQKDLYTKNIQN